MLFGYLLATVTVIIWGITFVCTKSLLQDFSALEILFFRFIIAYIGLWIMNPKSEKIVYPIGCFPDGLSSSGIGAEYGRYSRLFGIYCG